MKNIFFGLLILFSINDSFSQSASYGATGYNVYAKGKWYYYTTPSAFTTADSFRLVYFKQLRDSARTFRDSVAALRSSIGGGTPSQWTDISGGIGYVNNVSIGTLTPNAAPLYVYKSVNAGALMNFENPNAGSSAFAGVQATTNAGSYYLYKTSTAYGSGLGNATVLQDPAGDIVLYGATENVRFKNNGAVAFNGSYGTAGQVLTTAGSGAGLTWTTPINGGENLEATLLLGSTLTANRTISTGANRLIVQGSSVSPILMGDNTTNGGGVWGASVDGYGVLGSSTTGRGGSFTGETGISATGDNVGGAFLSPVSPLKSGNQSNSGGAVEGLMLSRLGTYTPAANDALRITWEAPVTGGTIVPLAHLDAAITDPAFASRKSRLEFYLTHNAVMVGPMTLHSTGMLNLASYTSVGAITSGTPIGHLQYDASGNIIAGPIVSITGTSMVIINDANYTVASGVTHVVYSNTTAIRTVTLPTASANTNRSITVRHGGLGAFTLTISPNFRQNNSTTGSSIAVDGWMTFISDGTDWYISAYK